MRGGGKKRGRGGAESQDVPSPSTQAFADLEALKKSLEVGDRFSPEAFRAWDSIRSFACTGNLDDVLFDDARAFLELFRYVRDKISGSVADVSLSQKSQAVDESVRSHALAITNGLIDMEMYELQNDRASTVLQLRMLGAAQQEDDVALSNGELQTMMHTMFRIIGNIEKLDNSVSDLKADVKRLKNGLDTMRTLMKDLPNGTSEARGRGPNNKRGGASVSVSTRRWLNSLQADKDDDEVRAARDGDEDEEDEEEEDSASENAQAFTSDEVKRVSQLLPEFVEKVAKSLYQGVKNVAKATAEQLLAARVKSSMYPDRLEDEDNLDSWLQEARFGNLFEPKTIREIRALSETSKKKFVGEIKECYKVARRAVYNQIRLVLTSLFDMPAEQPKERSGTPKEPKRKTNEKDEAWEKRNSSYVAAQRTMQEWKTARAAKNLPLFKNILQEKQLQERLADVTVQVFYLQCTHAQVQQAQLCHYFHIVCFVYKRWRAGRDMAPKTGEVASRVLKSVEDNLCDQDATVNGWMQAALERARERAARRE